MSRRYYEGGATIPDNQGIVPEGLVTTKRVGPRKPYVPPIGLQIDLDRLRALLPLADAESDNSVVALWAAEIRAIIDANGRGYDTAYLALRYERQLRPDPEFVALVSKAELEAPDGR